MTWNAEEFVNKTLHERSLERPGRDTGQGDHVAILMALCNGAATVDAQLASFADQHHGNWSLVVSDDRSRDDGPARVLGFAARDGRPVQLLRGPGRGFASNFLSLLRAAGPAAPFAALSDQDDIWLPGKLTRALDLLSDVPDGQPALYAARTVICDANMVPLRKSPLFDRPPSFRNALVQSIGGGNTMVLNRAALDLAQDTARHAEGIIAHDWWLYQIISGAGGRIIYDPEPSVLYRQHGANLIGANDTAMASLKRAVQLMQGRFRDWNTANIRALDSAAHWLTPEARETLDLFKAMRDGSPRQRLRAFRRSGIYRQTRRGQRALCLATVLNRV